jgi:crotonobetainyl-CoA:carnitine CoA-transferase CaiB-like acyl-CoA transferase
VAPVNDVAQALDSDFVREKGLVVDVAHPARGEIRLLASPVQCPGETPALRAAPALGVNNDLLLGG